MKILVCVKNVPDTSESDVAVDGSGKNIQLSGLKFDINEADNYAVEEAILTKEANEGSEVKVISMANKDADVMIRMTLAKGGDSAIRLEDDRVNQRDPIQVARALAGIIKNEEYDLIFTGCMSSDDKNMAVGVALAEMLGANHANMVKGCEVSGNKAVVQRELEGGLLEETEVMLPAVVAVQTGINTPRYAPVRELRKAMKKEIKVVSLDDVGVDPATVSEENSKVELLKLYVPVVESNAEMLEGSPDEMAEEISFKLMKGGLL